MTKKASVDNTLITKSSNNKAIDSKYNKPFIKMNIAHWKKELQTLSYSECIQSLDLLIEKLKNDDFPIEELEDNYLKGKFYLEHCEELLTNIEQKIIELDPKTLEPKG